METKYLIFTYEPYDLHHKVSPPHFGADSTDAYNHIMELRTRKELLFIDLYSVSDSLVTLKFDNKIPVSVLKRMFADIEKEGETT